MFYNKIILVLLSVFVFAIPAFATFTPGENNLSLGGVTTSPNLSIPESNKPGYFTLYASANVTAAHVTPLIKNGVPYHVTGGKTFKTTSICGWSATAGTLYQLMSDTVTFAVDATVGSLTAPVWQGGAAQIYPLVFMVSTVWNCTSTTMDFASGTWPGIESAAGSVASGVFVIGKEI